MTARPPAFWAASILLHTAVLLGLWVLAPNTLRTAPQVRDERLIQASAAQAQRMQMQRQVQALEKTQRQMSGGGPPPAPAPTSDDPQALLERAKAAQSAIAQALEKSQAQELARLLDIPPAQALAKLRAQAAPAKPATPSTTPPTTPPTPAEAAAQIADLSARAQGAAQAQHDLARRQAQGSAVALEGADANGSGGGAAGSSERAGGAGGAGPSGFFKDARTFSPRGRADATALASQWRAEGRTLGSGGARADRVYLNVWYIAGPFAGRGPASQATVYPPEQGVNLDAVYAGAAGRSLRWRYVNEARYPLVPQPEAENAVYYAYTEVFAEQAQDVWLDLGADDDARLWLNDELVWTSDNGDKPWYTAPYSSLGKQVAAYGLVEASQRVHLQAGRNTLLLKLYNGCCLMFFSVVMRP